MIHALQPADFFENFKSLKSLIIDARSEKEFLHAHIPGAVNIPLLNDEHRHLVGIDYKQNGQQSAVALGFKLAGPLFHTFIQQANELRNGKNVIVHCWRGGLRSSIMSWILSTAGINVSVLNGGYKSFRRFILAQFGKKKNIIVIGGNTGAGKTEILSALQHSGEQVICLESIAHHRGSAFGALGLPPQPSIEQFENNLGTELFHIDENKPVWLEAESRSVGRVIIPDAFFSQLQTAPLIEVECSREMRKQNIMRVYGTFSHDELAQCTKKLTKRLGHLRVSQALNALQSENYDEWLEILLTYYDKFYAFTLNERKSEKVISYSRKENADAEMCVAEIKKLIPQIINSQLI